MTPEQRAASSFWSVVITADDGVHPVVQQTVSLILINAQSDSCPEARPQFNTSHWVISTVPSFEIMPLRRMPKAGRIDGSRVARFGNPGSLVTEMTELSPGLFNGTIQATPVPGSQAAVFRYRLVARDNDDVTGSACDHAVSIPKSAELTFVAYGPDATDDCKEDAFEPNEQAISAAPIAPGPRSAPKLRWR